MLVEEPLDALPGIGQHVLAGEVVKLARVDDELEVFLPREQIVNEPYRVQIGNYSVEPRSHRAMAEPDGVFLQKPFSPDALVRKVREVQDPSPRV